MAPRTPQSNIGAIPGHLVDGMEANMVGRFFKGLFGGGDDSNRETSSAQAEAPPEHREHFDRAVTLLVSGEVQEAISEFDAAIELHPTDWLSFQNRGSA